MPTAYNLIRSSPWYRRAAFSSGLARAGFSVSDAQPSTGRPGDVLVIWNRYGPMDTVATRFERSGGTVIVAENGYLGRGGSSPKFDVHPNGPTAEHYYAMAIGGHNGQGSWPSGGPERWERLGVEIKERPAGEHVLVCPNRPFGVPGRTMAEDWADRTAARIRKETKREVRIRRHPGNNAPARPLLEDLKSAWAVVIWSSGAGIHALVAGVPVFVESPWWVCKAAAAGGTIDMPATQDPLPALRSMAWAQWKVREIETGEAFASLLSATREGAIA